MFPDQTKHPTLRQRGFETRSALNSDGCFIGVKLSSGPFQTGEQ